MNILNDSRKIFWRIRKNRVLEKMDITVKNRVLEDILFLFEIDIERFEPRLTKTSFNSNYL